MKSMLIFAAAMACATASQLVYPGVAALPGPIAVRTPSHDSAIIQSHRLGGNFAYSTHEAHAYGIQTPIIKHQTVPVGVSYHHGTPIVKSSTNYVTQQIPRYGVAHTQYSTVGAVPYPYAGIGAAPGFVAPAIGAAHGFVAPAIGATHGFVAPAYGTHAAFVAPATPVEAVEQA